MEQRYGLDPAQFGEAGAAAAGAGAAAATGDRGSGGRCAVM
jgi:hypothetical protein